MTTKTSAETGNTTADQLDEARSDVLYKRWVEELSQIHADVFDLITNRHVFHRLQDAVVVNPHAKKNGYFFNWTRNLYIANQVVIVRRLIDTNRDSISLVGFLESLIANFRVMTRERHLAIYGAGIRQLGESLFNKYADVGSPTIDVKKIQDDLATVLNTTKPIKKYTNKHVAHLDRNRHAITVKWGDLWDSIDILAKVTKKYRLLVEAHDHSINPPEFQKDWRAIFKQPWTLPAETREPWLEHTVEEPPKNPKSLID